MDAAVSGMRTAGLRMAVSAHNLANMNTSGFRAYRAVQRELPNSSGAAVYTVGTDLPVDPNVELIDQRLDLRYMQANGAVMKTSMEMKGELIDLLS